MFVPALLLAAALTAPAEKALESAMPPDDDPFLWLEDVQGERALQWVRAQNARAEAGLASTPAFARLEREIRAILDSDAKIPAVEKLGPRYYNFWKDARHERGLWRRTTLAEYRKARPRWETVLDVDALNREESASWVFRGANCLKPAYERCLVELSPGGSDAGVTREFDLVAKRFVDGGFVRPEAKGGMDWIDRDRAFVFTDFGPGSMTASGYPRVVKEWRRGTPLAEAKTVFEGKPDDMAVAGVHDSTPGFERDFVVRTIAFYRDELYLRRPDGTLTKIDAPDSAQKSVQREWLLLELREPYTAGGTTYAAGSLLASRLDAFLAGERTFEVLFEPDARSALAGTTWTRRHLVLDVLRDVRHELTVLTPGPRGWRRSPFVGAPAFATVGVGAVDADTSDAVWLTATDYLTPTTFSLATVGRRPEVLKRMPRFFDASRHVIEQHFATSKDGTRVPYFLVRPKRLELDGSAPTLLYGYGGFEISLTPSYSGTLGKAWLERGGTYVVANIRGGGEYGPRWHQAALRENRPRAFEDFAAVAEDLVARKITSPRRLGIMGGSNGGLLVGNLLVRRPELFGAVVVQVPLLDMRRYTKLLAGASWAAEYGDPDGPDWEFIRTFSPYHLLDPAKRYPPTLFLTSTRDDRVHPGHARKMAAKMLAAGQDVLTYENVEGGHGGSATNAQAAHMSALAFAFLWERLGGGDG